MPLPERHATRASAVPACTDRGVPGVPVQRPHCRVATQPVSYRRYPLADPEPNDDELAEIGDRCRAALTRPGMRTGRQLPDRLAVRTMPL